MYRISSFLQYLTAVSAKWGVSTEVAVTSDIYLLVSLIYFHWPSFYSPLLLHFWSM
jgi:hypothetical protein